MPEPTAVFADEVFEPLSQIYGAAAGEASEGALSFDHLDKKAAEFARTRGGELIGQNEADWSIVKTRQDKANELLQEAMKEGISPQEFGERLRATGLWSEADADMVARTEVAIAQNYGQSETYSEMGFSRVYVQDGDCDVCREVDGKVASIAWIQENPVGHPNCVRSCSPAPDDEPIELE